MILLRRNNDREYCFVNVAGGLDCYDYGFWYSNTGTIVKFSILAAIFLFFLAWLIGGYLHAKSRMKKGKKLLGYHRWLVSYSEKRKYGQLPQNHFTFYAVQQQQQQPYTQRNDSAWPEAPPVYNGNDAPPSYYGPPPPPPATTNPASPKPAFPMGNLNANGQAQGAAGLGPQQTGVVGAEGQGQRNQQQTTTLPTRPEQAKVAISKFVSSFRR